MYLQDKEREREWTMIGNLGIAFEENDKRDLMHNIVEELNWLELLYMEGCSRQTADNAKFVRWAMNAVDRYHSCLSCVRKKRTRSLNDIVTAIKKDLCTTESSN